MVVNMEYIKFGHGKWIPKGWRVNLSMKDINQAASFLEKAIEKVLSDRCNGDDLY